MERRRRHEVEESVSVEVVHDRTSGEIEDAHSEIERAILPAGEVTRRLERTFGEPEPLGNAVGKVPTRHPHQVEGPAGGSMIGLLGENLGGDVAGFSRVIGPTMNAAIVEWEDAARRGVIEEAILVFGSL